MRDFTQLADDVSLLVDSVEYKRKRLAEIGDKIAEHRSDAEAKSQQAKVYDDLAKSNREESEALRKAAGRLIDEELTIKTELKTDEKNLEELEAAFSKVGLKVERFQKPADDDDPDLELIESDVDDADGSAERFEAVSDRRKELTDQALDGDAETDEELEAEEFDLVKGDEDEPDGTIVVDTSSTETAGEAVDLVEEVFESVRENGDLPSADEVQDKIDTFVDTIRTKHERPDQGAVISAVHEFTEQEAIDAGREDEIRDEVKAAKNAG